MIDPKIKDKLIDELKVRNSRLMAPHIGTLFIISLFFMELHYLVPQTAWVYPIILTSLLIRYVIMKKFFRSYKNGNCITVGIFHVFVSLTSFGWGLLYYEIEKAYGIFHTNSLLCLGIIFMLMSGGVTAFTSSVKTAIIFILSAAVVPVYILWTDGHNSKVLAIFLFGNALYQIYHMRVNHKFLRKTIETQINATNQKDILQEYINAVPGIVGVIDKEGTYVMINDYLNGEIRNAILGTKVGATLKDNAISLLILEFMRSSETHLMKEIHSPDMAGDNWYMVNLKKISSPQEGLIASILPINELIHAKNELKIQEARSQYAAKLASVGEFSASIAHEVNNPLTIIAGAANQLKGVLKDSPHDFASMNLLSDKIQETTHRISRIIKSLKILSSGGDEEPYRNVSFASIVEPTIEITKQKVTQHEISIKVSGLDNPVELFGSEIQLSQVIMNLVSNAIDAVKESETKLIEIQYTSSLEWLDICVVDSGPGIPVEYRSMIMDSFFSTKGTGQGTGLGLSISKNIIEHHNGTLTLVEDAPHTTFRIRFPRMT